MSQSSKGLGDSIKKITSYIGIPQCQACRSRQEKLNSMFPYSKKHATSSREPSKEEHDFLFKLSSKERNHMSENEISRFFSLYNEIYTPKVPLEPCKCSNFVKTTIEAMIQLKKKEDE